MPSPHAQAFARSKERARLANADAYAAGVRLAAMMLRDAADSDTGDIDEAFDEVTTLLQFVTDAKLASGLADGAIYQHRHTLELRDTHPDDSR